MLELFWKLSSTEKEVRICAVKDLMAILTEKQNDNNTSHDDLDYCLKRLVRGLSSSRDCARQGFSLALIQVLF